MEILKTVLECIMYGCLGWLIAKYLINRSFKKNKDFHITRLNGYIDQLEVAGRSLVKYSMKLEEVLIESFNGKDTESLRIRIRTLEKLVDVDKQIKENYLARRRLEKKLKRIEEL